MSNDEPKRRGLNNGTSLGDSLDNFIKELRNSTTKLSQQKLIELSKTCQSNELKYTTIGTPITVSWQSPSETHSIRDWVGLYKIVQTSYSRNKTILSSAGRWTYCTDATGVFTFEKEKLFWEEGVYEFRYHLDGKHDVAYISEPFEIKTIETEIFDKVVDVKSVDEPLAPIANQSDNVIEVYKLFSSLISKSTHINVNYRIFLNNDNLSINDVAHKLIDIKQVLEELSFNSSEKKNL
ncbi:Phosphatidylethanolamine N-methyltransferase [Candida viswanathii]|uniref:Phosphatidylethanolamine N-methyltransferase n=1 Tax=Candida viswanathii TaxID=5486 RepID=A0A367YA04_9ASCO|nr:Phosphatidylethanolamine N-methyltransferase [Candida viswanathii]